MKYIFVYGNPIDGFRFVGPFDDRDEAVEYGESEPPGSADWWIAELDKPSE